MVRGRTHLKLPLAIQFNVRYAVFVGVGPTLLGVTDMATQAQSNLKGAFASAMRTGNIPSHNSPDGPVRVSEDCIKHYSHKHRDEKGHVIHPPLRQPEVYMPGQVSRFAPK